jgi:hypothetical protein
MESLRQDFSFKEVIPNIINDTAKIRLAQRKEDGLCKIDILGANQLIRTLMREIVG